jgi:hypothetical protein
MGMVADGLGWVTAQYTWNGAVCEHRLGLGVRAGTPRRFLDKTKLAGVLHKFIAIKYGSSIDFNMKCSL